MSVESFRGSGFFTLSECVTYLNGSVSESTLRREIRDGNLIARKVRRCLRVEQEEMDRWKHEGAPQRTAIAS